jgi:hypothetical protein
MKALAFALPISLALLTLPATAEVVFSNFPIDGTKGGWPISGPAPVAVSNSFTLDEDAMVNTVSFGALIANGGVVNSVDWVIGTVDFSDSTAPVPGSVLAAGTGFTTTLFLRNNGFDVDQVTFSMPDLFLDSDGTYYLTLTNADASTGFVFWDENDGTHSQYAWFDGGVGPALIQDPGDGTGCPAVITLAGGSGNCTDSFELATPEPSTLALLGAGILAAFVLRRRRAVSR